MVKNYLSFLRKEYEKIKANSKYSIYLNEGVNLFTGGKCILLTQSANKYKFSVYDGNLSFEVWVLIGLGLELTCECDNKLICEHKIAGICNTISLIEKEKKFYNLNGYRYTRSGMIDRVINERWNKAINADYKVEFSQNRFGEHNLINENGSAYKLTLRDLKKETGYCSCPDYGINKLATCKHLMYIYNLIKKDSERFPVNEDTFPFVEIYLNPLNNYKISWYYPGRIENTEISELLYEYFGNSVFLPDEKVIHFLGFLQKSKKITKIKVRPEVNKKVEIAYNKNMLDQLRTSVKIDFSLIKRVVTDYQKKGIEFAVFNNSIVMADESKLDNRTQVIAAALMKKQIVGLKNCLIICSNEVINSWVEEILELTGYNAEIISESYQSWSYFYNPDSYFFLIDWQMIEHLKKNLSSNQFDLLIIDEAHEIRNLKNKPAQIINLIERKHTIAISEIPLYKRLPDLYFILSMVDNSILSPLWEYSYNYYYFDQNEKNKIAGYYNIDELQKRLENIVLSRIIEDTGLQLPEIPDFSKLIDLDNLKMIINENLDLISSVLENTSKSKIETSDREINIDHNTGEVSIKFRMLSKD